MNIKQFVVTGLVVCSGVVASACFHQGEPVKIDATQNESIQNADTTIVTQDGLITTFPTADLPVIDRVEVLTSLRNESATGSVTHEAEYISNTSVSELYADYKQQLTRAGWTEQNPQTQQVGAIQIMSGTFVRGNDTISIAIQTSAGTKKELGATTVLLKIEQVN